MPKQITLVSCGAVLGCFLLQSVLQAQSVGLAAEMVIYNGNILTADSPDPNSFSTAEAAAIYGGKFVFVGSSREALEFAGASTKKIDLGGRTVIPGLVETHDHIQSYSSHFFPEGRIPGSDPLLSWRS